jgi:hypothetical protein
MKNEREYINFLRSFYESAKNLSEKDRLNFYDSILGYSFDDNFKINLSKNNLSLWTLVKPILDKSFTNYKNRKNK